MTSRFTLANEEKMIKEEWTVGTNTSINGNDSSGNLGVRRISGHIKHQKSFESSMGLIAEENSDGLHRTIMTKRNHSSASVSRK
ncbi:hypothetical protein RhiirA4_545689 [Rhizophagus irregularis]|uniref:Uncharacterized protein n=1 Tax=Rhizophagus irregularis TaxID=588596 RepID=A0A2I1GTX2_9GLOM|nr:hypothetical protein RhiirA4_545689 [Rhizophagus irregularis]